MKTTQIICNILAIIMFIIAGIMINEGLDKVNNYYNSDSFPSLNENAYVGGDAYNYIINANYATGYYVLAMICVIAGFGLIIIGYLSQMAYLQKEANEIAESIQTSTLGDGTAIGNPNKFSDLPEL